VSYDISFLVAFCSFLADKISIDICLLCDEKLLVMCSLFGEL